METPTTRLLRSACAAIVLAVVCAPGAPSHAAVCLPSLTGVESVLSSHVTDRGLPGAAVAVFDADGSVNREVWIGSYDAATYVPLASATKAVSAAVVMRVVDDGTLGLDDTVADYLPQYDGTVNGTMTVRQLFSQTSGLWNDEWPCIGDGATTLEDCALDILDNAPRISDPGKSFFYGGNSMHVAGYLAEVAYCRRFPDECVGLGSGVVWSRIFNQRLKGPLGLGIVYNSLTNPRIAGGAASRLSDYRTFWRMILGGGEVDGVRVLSTGAVAEMTRDQTGGAPVYYSAAQPDVRYGLAIWRFDTSRDGTARMLSDPGKFGFHPWIDVEAGIGGIVIQNDPVGAAEGGGRHIAFQIQQIVRRRWMAGDGDADGDGACDAADTCPDVFDPLQGDVDGDGAGDACDCAMTNARVWSVPGETGRALFYGPDTCLIVTRNEITGNTTCFPTTDLLDWFQPERPGGVATDLRYDVIRSPDVSDFMHADSVCSATDLDRSGPFNALYLLDDPAGGGLDGFLVRPGNTCGDGPAGRSGAGDTLIARPCP